MCASIDIHQFLAYFGHLLWKIGDKLFDACFLVGQWFPSPTDIISKEFLGFFQWIDRNEYWSEAVMLRMICSWSGKTLFTYSLKWLRKLLIFFFRTTIFRWFLISWQFWTIYREKERKRKRSRSRDRERKRDKRDKRDKSREKREKAERKERKPEYGEIKIKEEPIDDGMCFVSYSYCIWLFIIRSISPCQLRPKWVVYKFRNLLCAQALSRQHNRMYVFCTVSLARVT